MRIRTGIVTMAMAGMLAGTVLAAPAGAVQATAWTPAPLPTLEAIVKVVNARAKADKGDPHSPGCFTVLLLKGRKDFAAISLKPRANVAACGYAADFGVQAFRKSGSTWVYLGGTNGPVGTKCSYAKSTSAKYKRLMTSSGICR